MYLLERRFNDTDGFTNAAVDGVRLRMGWNKIQPTLNSAIDWTEPDRAVANAKKNGKQIKLGIAFLAAESNPTGFEEAGCKMVQLSIGKIPWINDPIFLREAGKLIAALGTRYDGQVTAVVMGGLGVKNFESHIANNPEDMAALDAAGGLDGWKNAVKEITQLYNNAFPNTRFVFTAGLPYNNKDGEAALREVIDFVAPKYGERFGLMNCALNAESGPNYPPNELVTKYAPTNACGLQFLTNCATGFGGATCKGTLQQVLDKGVEILKGKGDLEVYPKDADNPANAQLFKDTSAKLK